MVETSITERYKYTLPELLSNLGGAVGLMIGCSVMSVVEIVMTFVLYIVYSFKYQIFPQNIGKKRTLAAYYLNGENRMRNAYFPPLLYGDGIQLVVYYTAAIDPSTRSQGEH